MVICILSFTTLTLSNRCCGACLATEVKVCAGLIRARFKVEALQTQANQITPCSHYDSTEARVRGLKTRSRRIPI